MRSSARVAAEADGRGGTRLTTLHGEVPLLPRRTGPAEVHFVGGAAGPLGGDRLRIELFVGAGATLRVRTVAASIALPDRHGNPSRLDVHATVEVGGRLEWLPEPLIATARCRHTAVSTVELAAGAELLWRDELVAGRHGERPGDVRLLTRVHVDHVPVYCSDLSIGPSAPGWDGPAVLNGARVHATLLRYPGTDLPHEPAPGCAVLRLAGGGTVVTAVGDEVEDLRRCEAMDTCPQ
jgi:urease accessory protein